MHKTKIFIGLNVEGVDNLAIEGGESAEDFHITLLFGYENSGKSKSEIEAIIQSVVSDIKGSILLSVELVKVNTFNPSDSSDGKYVIYAEPSEEDKNKLNNLHEKIMSSLSKSGLKIEKTFDVYNPHMTLAYVEKVPEKIDFSKSKGQVKSLIYSIDGDKENNFNFQIKKSDEDKRLVFGWASVAIDKSGVPIEDLQGDLIEPAELETAAYDYVLNFRDTGEEHIPNLRKRGRMIESCVFTKEKQEAIGIPENTVPEGWWIGFYIDDEDAWKKIKSGEYTMFSVEGKAVREPVEAVEKKVGLTFSEIIERSNNNEQ